MPKPRKKIAKHRKRKLNVELKQRVTLVEKNDKTRVARKVYPLSKMRLPADAGLNFRIKLRRKE